MRARTWGQMLRARDLVGLAAALREDERQALEADNTDAPVEEEPADQSPEERISARLWGQMLRAPTAAQDSVDLAVVSSVYREEERQAIEVDNTDAPVEETLPRRRRGPWYLRPREPVESVEDYSTDASVEETAVDYRAPAARRPGHATPTSSGCDAHSWRRIGGRGTCQSCNTLMPNFLFRCRTCAHTSCRRCR